MLFFTIQFTQVFQGTAIAEDKTCMYYSCVIDSEVKSRRLAENDKDSIIESRLARE